MANVDKLKRYKAFQASEIKRLRDIYDISRKALDDKKFFSSFKARYTQLQNIREEFVKNYNGILNILAVDKDADLTEEYKTLECFEAQYYDVLAAYSDLFESEKEKNITATQTPTVGASSHVNLPKIELTKFSGDIKTFPSFIQIYDALVHNNASLSDIEKFNYLLSSLKGQPLSTAQYLPMIASNYKVVYDNLVKRYTNKRLLANAYFSELENASKVSSDSAVELRRLLDTYHENLAALKNLDFPIEHWGFILVHMLMKRLDSGIVTRFELHHSSTEIPSYEILMQFLENHCITLEQIEHSSPKNRFKKADQVKLSQVAVNKPQQRSAFCATTAKSTNGLNCSLCKSSHWIYKCSQFLEKNPQDRYRLVKDLRLCLNCLSSSHGIKNCNSTSRCRTCKNKHHSLLHFSKATILPQSVGPKLESTDNSSRESVTIAPALDIATPSTSLSSFITDKNGVLLSTAQVEIKDSRGIFQKFRALLDSGAQLSFVSQKCANKLGLNKFNTTMSVQGLCQTQLVSKALGVELTLRPVGKATELFNINAVVLPKICTDLPSIPLNPTAWPHLSNIKLADPQFNIPGPIDILLGADIFPLLLTNGRIVGSDDTPVAINTIFGYILMGNTQLSEPIVNSFFCSIDNKSLDSLISQFWQLENVPKCTKLSPDDDRCEKLFLQTFHRDEISGRFVVSLPFRDMEPSFPDTRTLAIKKLRTLEFRLMKNSQLYVEYSNFLREYLELGHMERVLDSSIPRKSFYIPHNYVLKPDSPSTKLRTVFNASLKSSNGFSLNDHLFVGPKLQRDIVTILLNFRVHKFVFTADIKQMYRQILVNPSHLDYQRIVWRFSPTEEIQDFRLLTVTYGINCAPYLAIRVLLQLAEEGATKYPLATKALNSDTYMDDIVTGTNSLEDAYRIQNQLVHLLKEGGFELRKWASNEPALLASLPASYLLQNSLSFDSDDSFKILGLQWHPSRDVFSFKVNTLDRLCTKRNILSELARVFDPLGLLAPVTFFTKHLIQRLWCLGLGWDDMPPPDILRVWLKYRTELSLFSDLHIPRRLIPDNVVSFEMHGFCDASEKGYAAAVYLRLIDVDGGVFISLVCAKSRVAPLKRVSIPRLELCSAVLLADLMSFCLSVYKDQIRFNKTCAWSDSKVALSWIKSSPHKWQTFVSNRVAYIQEKIAPTNWYHVSSVDNPADCASRGLLPSELVNNSLWWGGPTFLQTSSDLCLESNSEITLYSSESLEEERKYSFNATVVSDSFNDLLERHSSLETLKRIVAYIVRYIHNIRNSDHRKNGSLENIELHDALFVIIKYTQNLHFSQDIIKLRQGNQPSKPFKKLNAFIDEQEILRVGGRLHHSMLTFDRKHPVLLPRSARLTWLLIENTHRKYLHAGPNIVQSILMQQFWILAPKRAIRSVLSKCIKCWRTNPQPCQPSMGNLPIVRVSQVKPFSVVGVDYAGPFLITMGRIRGAKTHKAYLCLFVCMATKALHLELSSDLSAEAFLAALRRFIARRGRCNKIYSDCGTNFVKAHKELSDYMKLASSQEAIEWHFNPPSAPHMGGIWESGVRAVKTHLIRVIGQQLLTYEELYTLLVQVEAILNSRPLTALSSDPNDLSALTPSHFLTLEPIKSIPDKDVTDVPLSRLNRWQLIQRMQQSFWTRWHTEYLHTLQQRGKWFHTTKPLSPGVLVLIKSDNLPSFQWHLGRVVQTFPGTDGVVRVASVRTSNGIFKRPVNKLCPLPVD